MALSSGLLAILFRPRAAVVASGGLPLDLVTGATAAFSTRLVRTAYAGQCMRVRRSSDSTEQDIGFSAGALDTSALLTFCGAGDGFVKTWYDQSGNTRDVTQATTTKQPKIVSSGSTITLINSQPCMTFDATDDVLSSTAALSTFITGAAYTVLHTARPASAGSGSAAGYSRRTVITDSGTFYWQSYGSNDFIAGHWFGAGHEATVSATFPSVHVGAHTFDSVNIRAWLEGGAASTTAYTNPVQTLTGTVAIGMVSGTQAMDGTVAEIIFYNSALSNADIDSVGGSMATYAGLTWTAVS